MKSTRLRLDPQGYIAGDAGVTQRVCAQAFSAVLDQVVSMRDRERARDGSVNILSLRTLRVFSDHKQETDSSTKGLVSLTLNVGQRQSGALVYAEHRDQTRRRLPRKVLAKLGINGSILYCS